MRTLREQIDLVGEVGMGAREDERVVRICLPEVVLEGDLAVKEGQPVVIFAHGSASSRHSPRNQFLARELNWAGIGTLLFDLVTREEDMDYERGFDIGLLTVRLEKVTRSLKQQPEGLKVRIPIQTGHRL
jgi:putative phosphoribosyl transferase